MVTQICDQEGIIHTTAAYILRAFSEYMRQKYDHIPRTAESIRRMVDCGLKKMPPAATKILEEPVIVDELLYAVKTGKTKKVPGRDGIYLEFFKRTLE
jgi:hypothetical protein